MLWYEVFKRIILKGFDVIFWDVFPENCDRNWAGAANFWDNDTSNISKIFSIFTFSFIHTSWTDYTWWAKKYILIHFYIQNCRKGSFSLNRKLSWLIKNDYLIELPCLLKYLSWSKSEMLIGKEHDDSKLKFYYFLS